MNLRLGRFGLQEGTAAVAVAALISGVFSLDVSATYARGNLCYAATAAGALLSVLLLGLLPKAMGPEADLGESFRLALGPLLGPVVTLPLILGLLLAAVLPLFRFLLAMERYIFVDADYVPLALYLLPVLLLLVTRGMECVARMAKLLALPAAFALGALLLLAGPAFRLYHLYPLFSPGFGAFCRQTGEALFRFLPGGLALIAVGRGCQGKKYVAAGVRRGLLLGGAGATMVQLGLGLTFFGPDMAPMSAPVYCMTMAARQDRLGLRLDVLVLFLWVMAGLAAAGFYLYAAALLLCRLTGGEDIRPVGALMGLLAVSLALLFNFDASVLQAVLRAVYARGSWLLLCPLLLLLLGRALTGRRP